MKYRFSATRLYSTLHTFVKKIKQIMPSKQRPLVCDYCPTRFKYRSVLEEHVQRLHPDRYGIETEYIFIDDQADTINYLVDYLKSDSASWAAYNQAQ